MISHALMKLMSNWTVMYLPKSIIPPHTTGCLVQVCVRCSSHWFSCHVWLLFNCNYHRTMRLSTYSLTAHWWHFNNQIMIHSDLIASRLEVWWLAVKDVVRLVKIAVDNVDMLGCVIERTVRDNRTCCKQF